MYIVIVGLGRMGFSLARQLEEEGHRVLGVDTDPECVERARTRLDVMALCESGFHVRGIEDTNVKDADLLVAVTGSDEVNIITCLLARKFGIPRHIARVSSSRLINAIGELERIACINPGQVTIDRLSTLMKTGALTESTEFADGRILLRAFLIDEDSPFAGKDLADLRQNSEIPFIAAAIRRGSELRIPRGNDRVEVGDRLYVLLERHSLDVFVAHFNLRHRARRVVVFGAGDLGRGLCGSLEEIVDDLILIDPDSTACDRAAALLTRTSVIHASPFERESLLDIKAGESDFFVSLSSNDEGNLAAALTAKRMGARRVVTLTSQPEYIDVFEPLPQLDVVVSPVWLSVGAIIRRVRAGRVHSLSMIAGRRGEALEMEIMSGAPADGKLVKHLNIPRHTILAAITDKRKALLPSGDTRLEAGQRVVIVCHCAVANEAMKLFKTD